MNIITLQKHSLDVAVIDSQDTLITDVQSALDLIATVSYQTGCDRLILPKTAIHENFFDLSTGLAGDILQKFVNYRVKVAIIGDFAGYSSQSLRAFITESNQGKHIFFAADKDVALGWLSRS